nr:D-2-hydroxyacid dehydrogenase [Maliibacterium massiliense]
MYILVEPNRVYPDAQGMRAAIRAIAPGAQVDIARPSRATDTQLARAEIIYGTPNPTRLKTARRLKWLQKDSAGVDKVVDRALYAHPQDIILTNARGVFGLPIAEHVVMCILAFNRHMADMVRAQDSETWLHLRQMRELAGATCVVVGLGDLGLSIAQYLHALGAHVIGVRRSGGVPPAGVDELVQTDRVEEVFPRAQYLVLALPVTPDTVGFLSAQRIALLPQDCLVVNVGRGVHIDTGALTEALQAQRIAGAALDVTDPEPLPAGHPLWHMPNVLITPHCSGLSDQRERRMMDLFLDNLARYVSGAPLRNRIDFDRGY